MFPANQLVFSTDVKACALRQYLQLVFARPVTEWYPLDYSIQC
jgi:hypothetical protein